MTANTARSKKAKGTRLEKEVAKMIEDVLGSSGINATRTPMSGAIDRFKGDIFTNLPLSIECKNSEKWTPIKWWEQTTNDARGTGKIPVLVMSKNLMKTPKAMLELDYLLEIIDYAIAGGWLQR